MILFYRIFTFFLFPLFILITYLRRFISKEDKKRFIEKISINETFFPRDKKIFWIHAASVGETNSVIPVIKELIKNNKKIFILLTTTTLSSSLLINKIKLNSDNFQHRFFSLDIQHLVKGFLNHWKPELIIFIDSEVWPNYLIEISKRKIPLVLLNGRISMKTFKRWKMIPSLSKKLFNLYDLCLPSSYESQENLKSLGAKNIRFIGNLKFCFTISKENRSNILDTYFKNQKVWCAASTHPGEEEIILRTHNLLKSKGLNIITILIPRHISRAQSLLKICKNFKLKSKIIEKDIEISKEYEILIVNSIGEMTKYFYSCRSIFMGKSFSKRLMKVGGQNPIEPAKCGCKIYHGPHVSNFAEIYSFLNEKKIAFKVNDEMDLAQNILKDFNNNNYKDNKNIEELDNYGHKILKQTTQEILNLKNDI